MRLFKKAAALFFCLALALSVMAVSALAAENDFKVELTRLDNKSAASGDIYSGDALTHADANSNNLYEYDQSEDVLYKVTLKAASADKAANVSAIDFKVSAASASGSADTTAADLGTVTVKSNYIASNGAVPKNTNDYYTLNLENGGSQVSVDATTGVDFALITVPITANAGHDDVITVEVSDVKVHTVGGTTTKSADGDTNAKVEIDPEYTIYFLNPKPNDNTGVMDADAKYAPSVSITSKDALTAGFLESHTYTMFDGVNFTGNDALKTPAKIDGYLFQKTYHVYKPSSAPTGWVATDWASSWADKYSVKLNYGEVTAIYGTGVTATYTKAAPDPTDSNYAPSNMDYGNVILVADYAPITYTVTYAVPDEPAANAQIVSAAPEKGTSTLGYTAATTGDNATAAKMEYTIESVHENDFSFGAATRDGYVFEGWTVGTPAIAGAADTNDPSTIGSSFWSDVQFTDHKADASDEETVKAVTYKDQSIASAKVFGNLTLTAKWAINGERKELAFTYANGSDVLILFAVNDTINSSARPYGTYKCGTGDMFILNGNEGHANNAKYAALFGKKGENDIVPATGWTIFGYIAPSGTEITFTAGNNLEADTNTKITYEGNVNKDAAIDATDYGIAFDMLKWKGTVDDPLYNYDTLTVENRLKAHTVADSVSGNIYGSIEDINDIMTKVGNSLS